MKGSGNGIFHEWGYFFLLSGCLATIFYLCYGGKTVIVSLGRRNFSVPLYSYGTTVIYVAGLLLTEMLHTIIKGLFSWQPVTILR